MRLSHTDRQVAESVRLVIGDLLRGLYGITYTIGSVHAGRDGLDLFLDRLIKTVERMEIARLLGRLHDQFCKLDSAASAVGPVTRDSGTECAGLERDAFYSLDLFVVVRVKGVDRDDRRDAV